MTSQNLSHTVVITPLAVPEQEPSERSAGPQHSGPQPLSPRLIGHPASLDAARPFALGRPAALGRLGHCPPLRRHRPGRTRSCPRRGPAERSGARPARRLDVSDALDPRPRGWRPDPSNRRPSSKRGGGQGAGGSPPTRDLCAWVHSPCGLPLPSVHARPLPPGPPAFVRGANSFFARDVSRPFFRALQFLVPQGSPSTLRC